MQKVYFLSGGESSAMMTILAKPTKNDIVLFTDTKREIARTYDFLDAIEENEEFKIHRAVFTHENAPGLEGYDAYLAAYNYNYLPNVSTRGCTRELKIRTAKRYLRQMGILYFEQHIGFRLDERDRVSGFKNGFKRVKTVFDLHNNLIDKEDVESFWAMKKYRLGIPNILKNCDLCFLKGKSNIIKILSEQPELAEPWINDEKLSGHTYIKGITYAELLNIAKSSNVKYDLESALPVYSCSCNSF